MAGKPYPKPSGSFRTSLGRRSQLQVHQIRARIYERDEHTCVAQQGYTCTSPLTIQHAIGRGMGGSAVLDRPCLLRAMCLEHNLLIERSAEFRELAEINGWSIPRFSTRLVTAIPVLYPGARWFLLDDTFGREQVWPAP